MFDALSFAEVDGQHAELLPARSVMSLFVASGGESHTTTCVGLINGSPVLGNVLAGILGIASANGGCNS